MYLHKIILHACHHVHGRLVAHHALPFPAQRALVLLARAREARPLPAFAGRTAEERRDLVDTFVTGPKASAFKYEGMFIFQNSNESSQKSTPYF